MLYLSTMILRIPHLDCIFNQVGNSHAFCRSQPKTYQPGCDAFDSVCQLEQDPLHDEVLQKNIFLQSKKYSKIGAILKSVFYFKRGVTL